MEDHAVQRDSSGEPMVDSSGQFFPTDKITHVFVQEKRAGWGREYAAEKRNGE
ncbi:MAG: hypothetical protein ACI9DC_002411 [Gammaproteobacteria bacterium]|jgi:hypothetical protein